MKKLTAVLVVLLLATSFSFADIYAPPTSTATYGASFFCAPLLTGPNATGINLGNYFINTVAPTPILALVPSISWTLVGDPAAFYQITLTDPLTSPLIPGGPQLHGQWLYTSSTGLFVNAPWWGTGFGGNTMETPGMGVVWPVNGTGADLNCTIPSTITFDPQTISTGTVPGPYTFTISLTVYATI